MILSVCCPLKKCIIWTQLNCVEHACLTHTCYCFFTSLVPALCLYSASLVHIFSKPCAYIQHLVNFVEGREGVGCIQKCHVVCRLQCPVLFFSVLIGKKNNDWWWERTISKVQGTRQMKAGHGHTHTHTHIYIYTQTHWCFNRIQSVIIYAHSCLPAIDVEVMSSESISICFI